MTKEEKQQLRDVGFKTLKSLAERANTEEVRLHAAVALLNRTGDPQPPASAGSVSFSAF